MNVKFLLAVGTLAGTIIGAGIFALPYIFKAAGLASGFFYLALAAAAYIAVYLMYAEIILKNAGDHRFVGYVRMYLGKGLSGLAVLMTIVEMILVLTIYLILSQSFGNLITAYGSGLDKMIIFWLLGSAAIFVGLRRIAWLEFLITAGLIAIILFIFVLGLPKLSFSPEAPWINFKNFFLPLAPVLFALSGRVAIPAVVRLSGDFKKAIVAGLLISAVVYAVFVVSVLAISPTVSPDAVSGLAGYAPAGILAIIGIFGILSLISSYITIGFDVYKSLELDLLWPDWLKFLAVVLGPLTLYFLGLQNFLGLISFTGGIFLALEGILIIWMWLRAAQKKLSLPIILLLSIFIVALVYEMVK
jgi:amino acid permease